MKKILTIGLAFLMLTGCANKEVYKKYVVAESVNRANYYEAAKNTPLVDIKLPAPDGEEYHIIVNQNIQYRAVQQIKDSEWVPVATAGVVGGLQFLTGWTSSHYNYKTQKNYVEALSGDDNPTIAIGDNASIDDSFEFSEVRNGSGNVGTSSDSTRTKKVMEVVGIGGAQ